MLNPYQAVHAEFERDPEGFVTDMLGIEINGQSGDELLCNCPVHEKSKTEKSLHVNVKKPFFNCYKCGAAGDVCNLVEFVKFKTSKNQRNCYIAVKEFCREHGIEARFGEYEEPLDEYVAIETLVKKASGHLLKNKPDAVAGLKEKYGFDEEALRHYEIGYIDKEVVRELIEEIPKMERHLYRLGIVDSDGKSTYEDWIVIPCQDRHRHYRYLVFRNKQGICDGCSKRYGKDNEEKYLNLKSIKELKVSKDYPFGEPYNVRSKDDAVIIVEGQFDAIALQDCGFNALALGTRSISDNMIENCGMGL